MWLWDGAVCLNKLKTKTNLIWANNPFFIYYY